MEKIVSAVWNNLCEKCYERMHAIMKMNGETECTVDTFDRGYHFCESCNDDVRAFIDINYATLQGDMESVQDLLDAGVDIDERDEEGETPLMNAYDNIENMRFLLDRGANVNAKSPFGTTVLYGAACIRNNIKVVKLLLKYGATVDNDEIKKCIKKINNDTGRTRTYDHTD